MSCPKVNLLLFTSQIYLNSKFSDDELFQSLRKKCPNGPEKVLCLDTFHAVNIARYREAFPSNKDFYFHLLFFFKGSLRRELTI